MLAIFVLGAKTFMKASSTETGRELCERIVKIGNWDDSENITGIKLGRELHEQIVKIGLWDDSENITEIDWHLRM